MDIHFFKDRLLVGWTGNHRRMVGWIHKWMTGWIYKIDVWLDGHKKIEVWLD